MNIHLATCMSMRREDRIFCNLFDPELIKYTGVTGMLYPRVYSGLCPDGPYYTPYTQGGPQKSKPLSGIIIKSY